MRVFQHSVTQRSVTQRKNFYPYFLYGTADAATALAAFCGAPQANRNDFYFFRNAGGELNQSELRLRSTNGCGTAESCVTLRYGIMLENAHKFRRACETF